MQYGNQLGGDGCHPVDGCLDGTPFLGAIFEYLAANVVYTGTEADDLPAVRGAQDRQRQDRHSSA